MPLSTFDKELPAVLSNADNLPSLPAVAMEVLRLAQDDESTIDDLADTISRDPALAVKLLKLSNSSLFNPGQEITTLKRATMVLGMKTVKLMSLSFSLVGALPKDGRSASFDLGQFWHRSAVLAVASRSLAELNAVRLQDEAFLCGLLGYIGKLIMSQCMGEAYASASAKEDGWPCLESEDAGLGFNSADVAATLLRDWELPPLIYMAVGHLGRHEHLPADAAEELRTLNQVLSVAAMAEEVLCGENKGGALGEMNGRAMQCFDMDEVAVQEFLAGLEAQINEAAEMLSIELPKGMTHQQIIGQAQVQLVQISIGTAADLRRSEKRSAALEEDNRELEVKATTDKLTGIANRAAFDAYLFQQIDARIGGKIPRALGIAILDVDKFKNFNDSHGHQAGDEVLRMIGSVLGSMTRKGDLAARYGGEEFAIICPQTTPFGLKTMCERLRQAVEELTIEFEGKTLSVTASFGAGCIASVESAQDGKNLVKLADRFLYKAKENGRNRSEVFPRVQFPGRG